MVAAATYTLIVLRFVEGYMHFQCHEKRTAAIAASAAAVVAAAAAAAVAEADAAGATGVVVVVIVVANRHGPLQKWPW